VGKGLKVKQDEFLNVCIFKPGTPGYENHPPLILQGHMDMVCEKNKGTVHDFLRDPLKLRVDGDFISAEGTTLGADNGIAVAICMALLDSDTVQHPPLEVIFTSDEEAGMSGAEGLDVSGFAGKRMINMDTDIEGTFITGCAGGVRVDFIIAVSNWEQPYSGFESYTLSIKGLKGGHSGAEINQERANSLRLLGRALSVLDMANVDFRIASASGGMKINAIPREAEAVLSIDAADVKAAEAALKTFRDSLKKEYRAVDPGLELTFTPGGEVTRIMTPIESDLLISALLLLPNGIQAMSMDLPGLVEASCNIGVLEMTDDDIIIRIMPRSSSQARLDLIKEQIQWMAFITGADADFSHEYPAWEYDPDSALRKTTAAIYKEFTGKDAELNAIHAGLECGILGAKIPGLDMISFGPNAYDIHTPDERLSVSSTERIWKFLIELLKNL
jgi:dipeptidase D